MESVSGYEMGEGLYLYSLVVNGQEMDTKRMILTKLFGIFIIIAYLCTLEARIVKSERKDYRPKTFEGLSVSMDDNGLSVDCGEDSCRICISDGDDFFDIADMAGSHTFSTIPASGYLCVTKSGYVPHKKWL